MAKKKRKKGWPWRQRTRLTKLHRRLRKQLDLGKLGFKSEKPIGPYRVDELNEKKRVIVEINGDHAHANPRMFAAHDVIRFYGYTAEEKWEKDAERQAYLESLGYTVVVVWETDDHKNKEWVINYFLR